MGIVVTLVVGLPMGLVVFASAPWDTVPSTAEAVGVWQVGNTDERMTLYPSHKVTFSNIPEGIVDAQAKNKDGSSPRITTAGKWGGFTNADGYGTHSWYVLDHKVGGYEVDGDIESEWFGPARELVISDLAPNRGFELDFHRISATP